MDEAWYYLLMMCSGGAQNIKMKNKDKAEKPEKSPRTNGIRGLKGLM